MLIVYGVIRTNLMRDILGLFVCMLLAGAIAGRHHLSAFINHVIEHTKLLTQHQLDSIFVRFFVVALLWFSVMSLIYYEANDLLAVDGFRKAYICSGAAVFLTSYKGLRPASKICYEIVFDD